MRTEEQKEVWRSIPNYEGIYEASNFGRVRRLARVNLYGRKLKGMVVKGSVLKSGYLTVNMSKNGKKKTTYVHKIIAVSFLNHTSCGYKVVVDHIDNNKLNNNADNLQLISQRENASKDSSNKTGFLGVLKNGDMFQSRIRINGRITNLGTFNTPELANKAYLKALREL